MTKTIDGNEIQKKPKNATIKSENTCNQKSEEKEEEVDRRQGKYICPHSFATLRHQQSPAQNYIQLRN